MSVRSRLETIEDKLSIREVVTIAIIWDGRQEEPWRSRALEARERNCPLRVVRIGVQDSADTLEEAEELVAAHRAKWPRTPFVVYRRSAPGREVLAEWDPPLPEWLQCDETDSDGESGGS